MIYEVLLCCFERKCPVPVHTANMEQSLMMKKFYVLSVVWYASTEHAESSHTILVNGFHQNRKLQILKNTTKTIIPYKNDAGKITLSGV